MAKHRRIGEATVQTLRMVDRLKLLRKGEHVAYDELSRILGEDAQQEGRHHVTSACRILLRSGYVLEAIVGVGVKRLEPEEVASLGLREHRRIHRKARRANRKLATMTPEEFGKLTREQQAQYTTGLARIGHLEAETTRQSWDTRVQISLASHARPTRPE